MRVAEVLRAKGTNVVSISPSATLHEAAALLFEYRIGALLVLDTHEQVAGILSERDIVATIAAKGADALATPVRDAMSSDVVICSPDEHLEELMTLMTEHRIRHLPVLQGTSVMGVISIGDVVKHRISEVTDESKALSDYIGLGR
jgi:CBS domain-containing protein